MIQKTLTEFSIRHPKLVMLLGVIITLIFLAAFPSLTTDTDPVNMLPKDNPAVTLYDQVKKEFKLNDFVGVGIRTKDGSSLFTVEALTRIHSITKEILEIKDQPPSNTTFSRILKKLQFLKKDKEMESQGPELLVAEDVVSISTVDDIIKNEAGELLVTPLMTEPPRTEKEAAGILAKLNANPMLSGKMTAKDGSLVGIFMPLAPGKKDRSYYLGEEIKKIAAKYLGENEEYYFAGLPIAESTFGNEMFLQMGVYAPLAGLVIFLLMLFFFRSVKVVAAPMILGIVVVTWSMGALIYSGNVIHIMSSMIPIFLLPIAVLDSIHILSMLNDKLSEYETTEDAIRAVMKDLFNPMFYTSITTMVGFMSLATTGIPPVMVFGVTIGFGVFLSWILSILFIPAYTVLLKKESLAGFGAKRGKSVIVEFVQVFKTMAWNGSRTVIIIAVVVLLISVIGISQIVVNDNPVRWFKDGHALRAADVAMNEKLAGTYLANLYFSLPVEPVEEAETKSDDFDEFAEEEEPVNVVTIKDPRVIAYMEKVDNFIKNVENEDGIKVVGNVTSITDMLRKIGDVAVNDNSLPDTREKASQFMFLFESGDLKKGKD
ncbi:MAG: MMPL family transporter, partial [bacterium]|nr:MMPL family transporter [bacterium]